MVESFARTDLIMRPIDSYYLEIYNGEREFFLIEYEMFDMTLRQYCTTFEVTKNQIEGLLRKQSKYCEDISEITIAGLEQMKIYDKFYIYTDHNTNQIQLRLNLIGPSSTLVNNKFKIESSSFLIPPLHLSTDTNKQMNIQWKKEQLDSYAHLLKNTNFQDLDEKISVLVSRDQLFSSLSEFNQEKFKLHNPAIFEIIQNHPKYQFFELFTVDNKQFTFKVFKSDKNNGDFCYLHGRKYDNLQQAEESKLEYQKLLESSAHFKGLLTTVSNVELIVFECDFYLLIEKVDRITSLDKRSYNMERFLSTIRSSNCSQMMTQFERATNWLPNYPISILQEILEFSFVMFIEHNLSITKFNLEYFFVNFDLKNSSKIIDTIIITQLELCEKSSINYFSLQLEQYLSEFLRLNYKEIFISHFWKSVDNFFRSISFEDTEQVKESYSAIKRTLAFIEDQYHSANSYNFKLQPNSVVLSTKDISLDKLSLSFILRENCPQKDRFDGLTILNQILKSEQFFDIQFSNLECANSFLDFYFPNPKKKIEINQQYTSQQIQPSYYPFIQNKVGQNQQSQLQTDDQMFSLDSKNIHQNINHNQVVQQCTHSLLKNEDDVVNQIQTGLSLRPSGQSNSINPNLQLDTIANSQSRVESKMNSQLNNNSLDESTQSVRYHHKEEQSKQVIENKHHSMKNQVSQSFLNNNLHKNYIFQEKPNPTLDNRDDNDDADDDELVLKSEIQKDGNSLMRINDKQDQRMEEMMMNEEREEVQDGINQRQFEQTLEQPQSSLQSDRLITIENIQLNNQNALLPPHKINVNHNDLLLSNLKGYPIRSPLLYPSTQLSLHSLSQINEHNQDSTIKEIKSLSHESRLDFDPIQKQSLPFQNLMDNCQPKSSMQLQLGEKQGPLDLQEQQEHSLNEKSQIQPKEPLLQSNGFIQSISMNNYTERTQLEVAPPFHQKESQYQFNTHPHIQENIQPMTQGMMNLSSSSQQQSVVDYLPQQKLSLNSNCYFYQQNQPNLTTYYPNLTSNVNQQPVSSSISIENISSSLRVNQNQLYPHPLLQQNIYPPVQMVTNLKDQLEEEGAVTQKLQQQVSITNSNNNQLSQRSEVIQNPFNSQPSNNSMQNSKPMLNQMMNNINNQSILLEMRPPPPLITQSMLANSNIISAAQNQYYLNQQNHVNYSKLLENKCIPSSLLPSFPPFATNQMRRADLNQTPVNSQFSQPSIQHYQHALQRQNMLPPIHIETYKRDEIGWNNLENENVKSISSFFNSSPSQEVSVEKQELMRELISLINNKDTISMSSEIIESKVELKQFRFWRGGESQNQFDSSNDEYIEGTKQCLSLTFTFLKIDKIVGIQIILTRKKFIFIINSDPFIGVYSKQILPFILQQASYYHDLHTVFGHQIKVDTCCELKEYFDTIHQLIFNQTSLKELTFNLNLAHLTNQCLSHQNLLQDHEQQLFKLEIVLTSNTLSTYQNNVRINNQSQSVLLFIRKLIHKMKNLHSFKLSSNFLLNFLNRKYARQKIIKMNHRLVHTSISIL